MTSLAVIESRIVRCARCPELRRYCREVAREKVARFREWEYWGRPVPGFGDPRAKVMIVGLAPAAHGANRTGRMFTGDRSGDFLYAALHRAGLANQPHAAHRNDGLKLTGAYISAGLRCAPPGNKPRPTQLDNCRPWLVSEIEIIRPAVIVSLGSIGWDSTLRALRELGVTLPRPRPRFSHGHAVAMGPVTVLGSYHVSQQNTFTGRLTPEMLDEVLRHACGLAENCTRYNF